MALVGSLPELKRMSAFELMKYVSSREMISTQKPTPSVSICGGRGDGLDTRTTAQHRPSHQTGSSSFSKTTRIK